MEGWYHKVYTCIVHGVSRLLVDDSYATGMSCSPVWRARSRAQQEPGGMCYLLPAGVFEVRGGGRGGTM